MTADYQFVLLDIQADEAITENEDGTYTIFINQKLTQEKQKQLAYHALKHIGLDDFSKDDVDAIEAIAHAS